MDPTALDESRLRRLIEAGRALVARLDLEGVLETVLDAARELTGARYAALGILDERKRDLKRFLTLGVDEETAAAIGELPRGRGVLGELIQHPEPLRLSDVTSDPRSYGFPPGHPVMRTFLGVPIQIRGEAWGNLYLTEKANGEDFGEADEAAVAVLADWAAIAIENARLYEGLARRRDEVELQRDQAERSVRALAVMTDIARSVGGETDLERILELIVNRGRVLVETRALLILLADGDELVVAATAGELDTDIRGARIPIDGTLPGQVLRAGRAERLPGRYELGAELGVSAEAAILVPLTFRGTASGVLAALDRVVDGPEFGPEDERLLRSFAASAATAVATAKSVEAERLRHSLEAAEQERKRWARELHDETLQALGGLRMLHSAALRSDASAAELRSAVEEGIELIDVEIDSLSALITELRPAALDEIGLAPALRTLAERKSREGGLAIDVLVHLGGNGDSRLPAETESMVYRLVQEALNNVAKHAGASRAEAVLERGDGTIEITVRDDGCGFDPSAANDGFGLIGMRERVGLAGGELRIEAAPGRGTTVLATIPLRPAGEPGQRSSRPQSST
ncbi:MAG: GAF domain-containing sensor histidine kinase [Solirubrobacterales bacterium]|nr:GAF domain-containing sensor histidine kinase [Solirubrobacterales bacterium]